LHNSQELTDLDTRTRKDISNQIETLNQLKFETPSHEAVAHNILANQIKTKSSIGPQWIEKLVKLTEYQTKLLNIPIMILDGGFSPDTFYRDQQLKSYLQIFPNKQNQSFALNKNLYGYIDAVSSTSEHPNEKIAYGLISIAHYLVNNDIRSEILSKRILSEMRALAAISKMGTSYSAELYLALNDILLRQDNSLKASESRTWFSSYHSYRDAFISKVSHIKTEPQKRLFAILFQFALSGHPRYTVDGKLPTEKAVNHGHHPFDQKLFPSRAKIIHEALKHVESVDRNTNFEKYRQVLYNIKRSHQFSNLHNVAGHRVSLLSYSRNCILKLKNFIEYIPF
jgi:hypothetical protein